MSYSDMLFEFQSIHGRAVFDKQLDAYQAYAYTYDEMSEFLHAKDELVSFKAFTALFVVAAMDRLEFVADDPFTQDVFEELKCVYSRLSSLGLGAGGGDDEKLMLEHVKMVSVFTGVGVG
ncbi:hypothetical protein OH708_14445 [Pseudomonas capsici]|uniref:hypothetical protein n=1 Tax=Pseudomonas capsici TaxID=2810614 RepID=UPI0021F11D8B|nr:hypothetical protein [Pseudomonas capsici]MCV4289116.1 hypothetical protein [Pseudomonas capsici]